MEIKSEIIIKKKKMMKDHDLPKMDGVHKRHTNTFYVPHNQKLNNQRRDIMM